MLVCAADDFIYNNNNTTHSHLHTDILPLLPKKTISSGSCIIYLDALVSIAYVCTMNFFLCVSQQPQFP